MNDIHIPKVHPEFNHIEYIGKANILKGTPFTEPIDQPQYDSIAMKIFQENIEQYSKLFEKVTLYPTTHTKERYYARINKCDYPRVIPANERFDLSKKFTERMLHFLYGVKGSHSCKYCPKSTNGVPYVKMKDSKGDMLMHKSDFIQSPDMEKEMDRGHTPIFQITTKFEFMEALDLALKKTRLFFCGETPITFKQKMLYDNMSEVLMAHAHDYLENWSRYGFVKQYGGTNSLATAHLSLPEILEIDDLRDFYHMTKDVVHWDLKEPLNPTVYEIRQNLYGFMSEMEKKWHDQIAQAMAEPICATCDGHILKRKTGNPSGSGATSTDNTIGHIVITFYQYITLYYELHGRLPEYEEIVQFVIASIYGDDDIESTFLRFWIENPFDSDAVQRFKTRVREIYLEFGLEIKESAFQVSHDLEGLEFLGSTFVYNKEHDHWFGQPRYNKVISSVFQYLDKPKTSVAYASTSLAIENLCAGMTDPIGILLKDFNRSYAKEILKTFPDLGESEKSVLIDIACSRFDSFKLATGFEVRYQASSNVDSNFYFFNRIMSNDGYGEGFKSDMAFKSGIDYIESINYIGRYNEMIMAGKFSSCDFCFERSGPDHIATFTCKTTFAGREFIGYGGSKAKAKNHCCYLICSYYDEKSNSLKSQPKIGADDLRNDIDLARRLRKTKLSGTELEDPSLWYERVSSKVEKPIRTPITVKPVVSMYPPPITIVQSTPKVATTPTLNRVDPNLEKITDLNNKIELMQNQIASLNYIIDEFYSREKRQEAFFLTLTSSIRDSYSACNCPGRDNSIISDLCQGSLSNAHSRMMNSFKNLDFSLMSLDTSSDHDDVEIDLNQPLEQNEEGRNQPTPSNQSAEMILNNLRSYVNRQYDTSNEIKTGSFNPYGNGQPQTKAKFIAKKLASGMSQAQAEKAWKEKKQRKTKQPAKRIQTVVVKEKRAPPARSNRGNTTDKQSAMSILSQTGKFQNVLTKCAASYMHALVRPFHLLDGMDQDTFWGRVYGDLGLPCIPTYPAVQSRKMYTLVRGDMVCGTNGSGVILCSPSRLANDYASDDSNCPIQVSTSTWAGTTSFPVCDQFIVHAPPVGIAAVNINTDYNSASLALSSGSTVQGVKYRVVAAGIRLQYVGNALTRSGTYHMIQTPDHASLSNSSINSLSNIPSYMEKCVDNKWHTITYCPVYEEETKYYADGVVNNAADNVGLSPAIMPIALLNHYLGILVVGAAASAPFRFEVLIYYEVIGAAVNGKSSSECDAVGLGCVSNIVNPSTAPIIDRNPEILEVIASSVPQTLIELRDSVGAGARKAINHIATQGTYASLMTGATMLAGYAANSASNRLNQERLPLPLFERTKERASHFYVGDKLNTIPTKYGIAYQYPFDGKYYVTDKVTNDVWQYEGSGYEDYPSLVGKAFDSNFDGMGHYVISYTRTGSNHVLVEVPRTIDKQVEKQELKRVSSNSNPILNTRSSGLE